MQYWKPWSVLIGRGLGLLLFVFFKLVLLFCLTDPDRLDFEWLSNFLLSLHTIAG